MPILDKEQVKLNMLNVGGRLSTNKMVDLLFKELLLNGPSEPTKPVIGCVSKWVGYGGRDPHISKLVMPAALIWKMQKLSAASN